MQKIDKTLTEPIPTAKSSVVKDNSTPNPTVPKHKYGNLAVNVKQNAVPTKRFSSTSTIVTDGDVGLNKPNYLVRSVCILLRQHIENGMNSTSAKLPACFSEKDKPLNIPGDPQPRAFVVASVEEIGAFIIMIVDQLELNSCVYLMALYYIEEMINADKLTLHPTNWRRICLSCLLLAGKVFHDEAPWNADASDSFPWIKLQEINFAEGKLLLFLNFSVTFTPQKYAHYYYLLREIAQREHGIFPSELLTQEELNVLESRTKARETVVIKQNYQSQSSPLDDRKKTKSGIIN